MSNVTPIAERKQAPSPTAETAAAPSVAKAPKRRWRRIVLIGVVPALALILGLTWWLSGGRYVTTDNAYVGAQKILITPQVAGAIAKIDVVEGQRVKAGDSLFEIDPAPYASALALAKGRVAAAQVAFKNLRASYSDNRAQIAMGEEAVALRQADYDRKTTLLNQRSGTNVERETSAAALIQAKQILAFVRQQQDATLVKLGGALDAPIENFPDYIQASAQVADAQRNLDNTHVVAPISGIATQVDQIQLGRLAPVGAPVFALIGDAELWIDASPKESDLTYIHTGLRAVVTIDSFPDRSWKGVIKSIAPGTGAQFSVIPAQNASGNWVKVTQRVPLRIAFDPGQDLANLRAGMSAYVSIDTGRQRSLSSLIGAPPVAVPQ